jgi:hypothetical protein
VEDCENKKNKNMKFKFCSSSFLMWITLCCLITKIKSFYQHRKYIQFNSKLFLFDEANELKKILQKTEMLILFPLSSVKMEGISQLRKLVKEANVLVLSRNKLVSLVDGSPYSQIVASNAATNSNFCIFVENSNMIEKYELILKWIRQVQKESWDLDNLNVLICKKGHLITIPISSFDKKGKESSE